MDQPDPVTTSPRRFYYAASFDLHSEARDLVAGLQAGSGWLCTSRWVNLDPPWPAPSEVAIMDLEDVEAADAILVDMTRRSTAGGLWFEFAWALAHGRPAILLYPAAGQWPEPPVFAHLPDRRISWARGYDDAAYQLRLLGEVAEAVDNRRG